MTNQKLNFDVQPLFVEPVFRASLSHAITDKQVKFIQALKMVENRGNFISEDLYIFEKPELAVIKAAVQTALDNYTKTVMGIKQKLYVTQSWSLTNPQNAGMHGHSHSNSLISGTLYYADLPEPVANMVFDRHRTYQQMELRPEPDQHNLYNTPANIVVPKTHDLVLFSSSLQHFVEPNLASKPRHAIAFNTFIKGKFGSYRDVSELTL
jgi:uncharacterized protein (TIGR02466 family)